MGTSLCGPLAEDMVLRFCPAARKRTFDFHLRTETNGTPLDHGRPQRSEDPPAERACAVDHQRKDDRGLHTRGRADGNSRARAADRPKSYWLYRSPGRLSQCRLAESAE